MATRPDVIALFGPTGIGKTALALALAERLRAIGEDPVAVSADALQVYRGLETLTGAATPDEQHQLEHRLVGILPVTESFSAGAYAERAHAEIDRLLRERRRPIVVGGTGLYLRAALAELDLRPPPEPGVRERLTAELQAGGPQELHARLQTLAPWRAEQIEPSDSHRIVRALELHAAGQLTPQPADSQLWTEQTRHPTLLVALTMDRERLYGRIDRRVEAMVAGGAIAEVAQAAARGASPTARKALGFEDLLRGDVEAMQRHTRQYARRQLTWLRKLPGTWRLDLTDTPAGVAAAAIAARWSGER